MASEDAAPVLPLFPDLSPLAASFPSSSSSSSPPPSTSTSLPPTPATDNLNDIWATVSANSSLSTQGYNPSYSSKPPPTPPPPPPPAGQHQIDDFDPFSPRTLGSTVKQDSRLELIDSESDEGGSPTEKRRFDEQQQQAAKGQQQALGVGHKRDGSGSFFGNVFRSISGTGSPLPSPSLVPHPHPPAPPPSHPSPPSTPVPSSSSHPSQLPPPAPQTPSGPSTLAKPFTSIASVFRSSPKPSPAGTPQPGSSPVLREKGAFMTAIVGAGGKGKERERERLTSPGAGHAPEEYSEKEGAGGGGGEDGRGKGREEPVFDFNRFLEQMRQRSADPIAKYLRSFLKEFSRRPPGSTTDQTRVINDFLDFIAGKMRTCDPWRSIVEVECKGDPERGEAEFEMAMEAMEKLVMNRLWHLTFTPALDLSLFPGHMSPSGDVERDHVLSQRIRLFGWVEPQHLDLPIPSASVVAREREAKKAAEEEGEKGEEQKVPLENGAESSEAGGGGDGKSGKKHVQGFLDFAQRELGKMNQYKAPRDKLICVLNCCKVIFGLMRHVAAGEEGADTFIPFLIYVVLKANPENLVSNLQYIQRFRNPEKLSGEGGYYLSSLNAAIAFIESLDASSLSNITQAEFENHVAEAVKTLAAEEPPPPVPQLDRRPSAFEAASQTSRPTSPTSRPPRFPSPANDPTQPPSAASEAASASLMLPSLADGASTPTSFPESTKQLLLRGTDAVERGMSKPLGALAKIFEQLEQTANELTGQPGPYPGQQQQQQHGAPPAPLPPSPTPSSYTSKRRSYLVPPRPGLPPLPPSSSPGASLDPALYAPEGAGDEEVLRAIDEQFEEKRRASLETLMSVFPSVEREVLEMVLLSSSGDVGKAIDSLLEMA